MSDRFFLDTNIFVYQFQSDQRKSECASGLIRSAISTKRGVVSYQVVEEFLALARTRFAKPLPLSDAEKYMSAVFKPLLAVHSSTRLFLEALRIHAQHQFSWYDSLIVAAAQQAQCSVLYSEDMQHGQRLGNLRIEDPFR